MLVPVLLAGGSGTRLWPLSRDQRPKQFLDLVGQGSLLAQTLDRVAALGRTHSPLLLGREEHRFLIAEQLAAAGIDDFSLLLEPVARNTAPALALASLYVREQYGAQAVQLVLPCDHVLNDADSFAEAVARAWELAAGDWLAAFGVRPTRAETGYGYIRAGEALGEAGHAIQRFVEKPDTATAQDYLDAGDYYWNSGMFVMTPATYLAQLAERAPAILECCERAYAGLSRDRQFLRVDEQAFKACPSESIDYAVMEGSDRAAVVPLAADWNDLGSWVSVADAAETDAAGNALRGDVLVEDVQGSLLRSEGRLVAALGVRNLTVVETADAVLVADKRRAQDVRLLVDQLKRKKRSEADEHKRVYRPWGFYETIAAGERFQVKRIQVKPGGKLSLQRHQHRAEHWVVVSGTARITRGEEQSLLSEDESTYIPIGTKHRLENPGEEPLVVIEVQSGGYLGEDDIERFDDVYGRADKDAE